MIRWSKLCATCTGSALARFTISRPPSARSPTPPTRPHRGADATTFVLLLWDRQEGEAGIFPGAAGRSGALFGPRRAPARPQRQVADQEEGGEEGAHRPGSQVGARVK